MAADRQGKRKWKENATKNSWQHMPGNRREGQGFADKLKEKIFHDYKKLQRKERTGSYDVQKIYEELESSDDETRHGHRGKKKETTQKQTPQRQSAQGSTSVHHKTQSSQPWQGESLKEEKRTGSGRRFEKRKQVSRFSRAQREYQKKAEEKEKKAEEARRQKMETEAALEKYKERKKQRFLKLCKRTSRGQPVMKNQVQLLIHKLQKQRSAETEASTSAS